jgi:hypothetical protein
MLTVFGVLDMRRDPKYLKITVDIKKDKDTQAMMMMMMMMSALLRRSATYRRYPMHKQEPKNSE